MQEPLRIEAQPSYHGHLNRERAELKLSQHCPQKGKKYLTRFSENSERYKISVVTRDGSGKLSFQHLTLIEKSNNTFRIDGALAEYNDIATLLKCHQEIPVGDKVTGIGECCVFRRLHSEEVSKGSRDDSSSSQKQKHRKLTSTRSENYKSQVSHEEVSSKWFLAGSADALLISIAGVSELYTRMLRKQHNTARPFKGSATPSA